MMIAQGIEWLDVAIARAESQHRILRAQREPLSIELPALSHRPNIAFARSEVRRAERIAVGVL
jgi:hypothetical protein